MWECGSAARVHRIHSDAKGPGTVDIKEEKIISCFSCRSMCKNFVNANANELMNLSQFVRVTVFLDDEFPRKYLERTTRNKKRF